MRIITIRFEIRLIILLDGSMDLVQTYHLSFFCVSSLEPSSSPPVTMRNGTKRKHRRPEAS